LLEIVRLLEEQIAMRCQVGQESTNYIEKARESRYIVGRRLRIADMLQAMLKFHATNALGAQPIEACLAQAKEFGGSERIRRRDKIFPKSTHKAGNNSPADSSSTIGYHSNSNRSCSHKFKGT
jgi:hypothetical protein